MTKQAHNPYCLLPLPLFSLGAQEPLRLARLGAEPRYVPIPTYKSECRRLDDTLSR